MRGERPRPGRRGRPPAAVELSVEDRAELERRERAATSSQRDADRARIVLAAGEGLGTAEIAARFGVSVDMVSTWRGRFAREGLKGLLDRPRSGRPSRLTPLQRAQIVSLACEPPPQEHGLAGWTLDRLHEQIVQRGIAEIGRSWLQVQLARADLQPHRRKMWLHSPDPEFREKTAAVVEMYVDPPEGVTVVSVDEKTGMQAVERKHPDRPAAPGRPLRREYEYVRHGTQSLLAALDVHKGKMLARCGPTRTAADLEAFMDELAARTPGQVVVIWDNLNIHHGERWERFNQRHGGRFRFLYTPLHASWVNQIELWFGVLQRRCLARGSFKSVEELRAAVLAFVAHWNDSAGRPFRWSFTGYPVAAAEAA
jgi:transposase